MEKKRVDVKETRNLAKNKGRRTKKRSFLQLTDTAATLAFVREARRGWELLKTSEVSVRTDSNNERVARRRQQQQQPLSTISCICWIISSYRAQ